MTRRLLALGLLAVVLHPGPTSAASIRARALDVIPVIDGDSSEWSEHFRRYDDDTDVAVMSDGTSLWLCVVFGDATQRKMLMANGLELTVKGAGAPGIRYPVALTRADQRPTAPPEDAQVRDRFLANLDAIEWVFDGASQRGSLATTRGIEIAANSFASVFVYEIRIPLDPDPEATWSPLRSLGKTVQLSLESPLPARPDRATMDGSRRGGRQGGGAGMAGGRGTVGGRTPGTAGRPDSIRVALKVVIEGR